MTELTRLYGMTVGSEVRLHQQRPVPAGAPVDLEIVLGAPVAASEETPPGRLLLDLRGSRRFHAAVQDHDGYLLRFFGTCDVAIVNHYYFARELDEKPDMNVKLFWASQEGAGTHVNISGAGITKSADAPRKAQRLLEWLASDGQQAFVGGNHEYPVNPEVAPDDVVAGFGKFKPMPVDAPVITARGFEEFGEKLSMEILLLWKDGSSWHALARAVLLLDFFFLNYVLEAEEHAVMVRVFALLRGHRRRITQVENDGEFFVMPKLVLCREVEAVLGDIPRRRIDFLAGGEIRVNDHRIAE